MRYELLDKPDCSMVKVTFDAPGEKMVLLDYRSIDLSPEDLLITDAEGPVALIYSRQNLDILDRGQQPGRSVLAPASGLAQGAYVLADAEGTPDLILIASGSEVQVALGARELLAQKGVAHEFRSTLPHGGTVGMVRGLRRLVSRLGRP